MKKIINKVLEEIKKEKPDLGYVRGLLEAMVDDEPTIYISPTTSTYVQTPTMGNVYPIKEEIDKVIDEIIDPAANADMAKIIKLANESSI